MSSQNTEATLQLGMLEAKDLQKLNWDSLERLAALSHAEFVRRSKEQIAECSAKKQQLDYKLLAEEEFVPKIAELFSAGGGSQPVKLNVGGQYFSTSLDNLTKEPNTFFSILCGGKWDMKINPDDKAVFIDRDPTLFPVILNYMRNGTIDLDDCTKTQLKALSVEADFYQIASLLAVLNRTKFLTSRFRGKIKFTELDSVATSEQPGEDSYVISWTPFSPSTMEMSVKIVAGARMLIGVASRDILTEDKCWSECGWYMFCGNGKLSGSDGKDNEAYGKPIKPGRIVTVKLDKDFNINFVVNGEDWGVAYKSIATDFTTQPLYLGVSFDGWSEKPNVIVEGAIQLVA